MTNGVYTGANGRTALFDLHQPEHFNGTYLIFCHGLMGYKDWGAWHLVEKYFVRLGFGFCRFNFSHNGTTLTSANEFKDPEAFGNNSYYKEHLDLKAILDLLEDFVQPYPRIHLIGHSRGGSIALSAADDSRVSKIITWAAVADPIERLGSPSEFTQWRKTGVKWLKNNRTQQDLPMYPIYFEETLAHREIFNFQSKLSICNKELLFLHGDADTSVEPNQMKLLEGWSGRKGLLVEGAQHTFGSVEPWHHEVLPVDLQKICDLSAQFILSKQPWKPQKEKV